ncbi:MAG: hypothetical protein JNM72_12900 [Deltaproteobacteria bacterium]|nr:hypothetical protein [Deltaproteobacteria bacterium]
MEGSSDDVPKPGPVTPATAMLNARLAAAPGPRVLTDEELRLLRLSTKEVLERVARRPR